MYAIVKHRELFGKWNNRKNSFLYCGKHRPTVVISRCRCCNDIYQTWGLGHNFKTIEPRGPGSFPNWFFSKPCTIMSTTQVMHKHIAVDSFKYCTHHFISHITKQQRSWPWSFYSSYLNLSKKCSPVGILVLIFPVSLPMMQSFLGRVAAILAK